MPLALPCVAPVLMLAVSNVFMTLAWYGHLTFKVTPLLTMFVGVSALYLREAVT